MNTRDKILEWFGQNSNARLVKIAAIKMDAACDISDYTLNWYGDILSITFKKSPDTYDGPTINLVCFNDEVSIY